VKEELDEIAGSSTPAETLQTVIEFLRRHHWIVEEAESPEGMLLVCCHCLTYDLILVVSFTLLRT